MQRILLLTILICTTIATFAVPARPGKRLVTFPDGTRREALLRGDEYCHWYVNPIDGTPIAGVLRSTALIERQRRMLDASPLRSVRQQRVARRAETQPGDLLLEGSFPTRGKHRLLALLINYANTTPTYSREQFDAMLNSEGYGGVGSFRDYFLDQSYGQLDIHTTVTPWITVAQPKQYYNIDNTPSLIADALRQLDGSINFRDFDNDHDGILDGLIVIHAGQGQEASGDITDIWSHSSTVYGMQFDGVSLYRYTIEPEILHDGPSTIGVFCHEFGHNLGALDYYDTNYSSDGSYAGTGPWDIMGEGAWNGDGGTGTRPAPFSAWQKWQFGWITPTVLDESQHIELLPTAASGIAPLPGSTTTTRPLRLNTTTEGDYFILENIQPTTPWTIDIPGHGLIATHVVESVFRQRMGMNNINSTFPQGIYTVCADAHSDPVDGRPSSYGDLTSSATPFPGTRGHDAFSDETLPSTHSADGRYSYVALQRIAETEGTISFDYIRGDVPIRPVDLAATVSRGVVTLTWTFPADKPHPIRCTVYRDGQRLATVDAPDANNGGSTTSSGNSASNGGSLYTYTDPDCAALGLVSYTVDATYADGLVSAVSTVLTRIPQHVASDFTATVAIDGPADADHSDAPLLRLSWSVPDELTRCVNDLHYDLVDHYAATFCYAHRFRADDLLPHLGQQIRSITFIPQQRSTDASYTICVWRTPSVRGTTPATLSADAVEVVAERAVSEFSPTYQRTFAFVTRPTIEAGYDYFVGVRINSNNGLAEAVTDQTEVQSGYGNLMSINGGAWQSDPSARGNYILSAVLAGEPSADDVRSQLFDAHYSSAEMPSIFADSYAPYDVNSDLFFPLGFTVFSDGARVAETTSSTGIDIPAHLLRVSPDGSVHLSLVSTYKQGNQSRSLDYTLTLSDYTDGVLCPTAPVGSSTCYDIQGRRVAHPTRGLYIVGGKKLVR